MGISPCRAGDCLLLRLIPKAPRSSTTSSHTRETFHRLQGFLLGDTRHVLLSGGFISVSMLICHVALSYIVSQV